MAMLMLKRSKYCIRSAIPDARMLAVQVGHERLSQILYSRRHVYVGVKSLTVIDEEMFVVTGAEKFMLGEEKTQEWQIL